MAPARPTGQNFNYLTPQNTAEPICCSKIPPPELVGISKDKRTYKGYLADEYVSDIEALKTCDMSATTKESTSPTSDSTKTTPYAVIVLFVALLAVLLL